LHGTDSFNYKFILLLAMCTEYLFLNLKAYSEVDGPFCEQVAAYAVEVTEETGVQVVVCPPYTWIQAAASSGAVVYAQHADAVDAGAKTGFMPPELLRHAGASGSILNHSEHRIGMEQIKFLVHKMRELGMHTLLCAETADSASSLAKLNPDFIAVEPPELIGTGISVSRAKPELIVEAVNSVASAGNIPLIAGAGIVDAADVRRARELGANGALVASAIVHSKRRRELIREMATALVL
jgi:triosephosphate isomerase